MRITYTEKTIIVKEFFADAVMYIAGNPDIYSMRAELVFQASFEPVAPYTFYLNDADNTEGSETYYKNGVKIDMHQVPISAYRELQETIYGYAEAYVVELVTGTEAEADTKTETGTRTKVQLKQGLLLTEELEEPEPEGEKI